MTLCIVMILAAVALLMMPLLRYILVGWKAKRKDIMDGLNPDARLAYFEMFSRAESTPSAADASAEFERLYARWYGRRFFVGPLLLLLLVSVIAITMVVLTVLHVNGYIWNPFSIHLTQPSLPSLACTCGPSMILFPPRVYWILLRPMFFGVPRIIAVPMGYAFAVIAPPVGPFVAFAIGAFPLAELTTMLQRLAKRIST